MVDFSSPLVWNFSKPPRGGRLLRTSWLWTYWPRRMEEREGQHSESVTKSFENVVPLSTSRELNFGNRDASKYRLRSRSSVRMNTMLGLVPGLAFGVEADAGTPPVATRLPTIPKAASSTTNDRARRCVFMGEECR